jgi:DNA-binding winged helix-turn-helix (wHTH) protein
MSPASFQFGPFRLDPRDRSLWRGGDRIDLGARYLDVLILLVEARGGLVTKDRFMDEVWRGVPVTDEALTQAIRTLRRALGDDANAPLYVETVPKHGYRFVAPVEETGAGPGARSAPTDPRLDPLGPDGSRQDFLRTIIAGVTGAALAGGGIGLVYGFVGAARPGAGTGGALSLLLVLALVTIFAAATAGLGIAAGIAAARFIRSREWYWSLAGGALGGLLLGAFGNLVGTDAFRLLLGNEPERFAGALEGALTGAAVGLAVAFGGRVRFPLALALAAGLAAGSVAALLDGRMMAGSLLELVRAFPGSSLRLGGLDSMGLLLSAAFEGAVFCAAMAWGLRRFDAPG